MNLAKTLVLTCAALGLSVAAHAQDIVVNGSTTVLPIMQKVSEAYMAANPNVQIALSGGGSGNGIKALGEKQCDVAMSSRDIKDKERAAAEKKGVKPVRIAVAVDAIVPVVNPENPVKDLSLISWPPSIPARCATGRNWAARTAPSWSSPATPLPVPSNPGRNWS